MDGLESLFDSVDLAGWKDELMDFAALGAGAVGATIAWSFVDGIIAQKMTFIPASVRGALPIIAGVAAAHYGAPLNRNVAMGAGVGLVALGIKNLVKAYAPASVAQYLNGLGEDAGVDPFSRYLNAAPTTIEEESVGAAPTTIEESVAGLHGFEASLQ
jgi:hypothetical protein